MALIREAVAKNELRQGGAASLPVATNWFGGVRQSSVDADAPISSVTPLTTNRSGLPTRGTFPPGIVLDSEFNDAVDFPRNVMRARILQASRVKASVKTSPASATATAGSTVKLPAGTPQQVTSLSASEVPTKLNGQMVAVVTASWVPATGDAFYSFAQVWVTGYHAIAGAQLVASGPSPLTFSMDATNETVSISAVAVSASGIKVLTGGAPSVQLVLSPTSGAPPAPVVSQTLVATAIGYQFQFNQEAGLLTNIIDGYNIYRNTTNSFSGATKIKYVKQSALTSGGGVYTFQDSNVPTGTTYFYFVTAVDIIGEESAATSAQTGTIANASIYTASSNLTSGTKLGGDNGLTAVGGTAQLGLAGTPIKRVHVFHSVHRFRFDDADNYTDDDTSVGGVVGGWGSGTDLAGDVSHRRAGSTRYRLTSGGHGFDGVASREVDIFGQYGQINAGAPGFLAHDTNVSGRRFDFLSGDSSAGIFNIGDGTAAVDRTYLNSTPRWGFFGSPAQDEELFGRISQISASQPLTQYNDTQASGRFYYESSGSQGAGIFGITDNTAAAVRTTLNSTPQWGFFGSPAFPLDLNAGSISARAVGAAPSWRVDDTNTSGRKYDFNSGNNVAGQMQLIDRTANVQRINMDSSGNIDFAGSTPTSGFITAAAGKISDTSGNLVLKNIGTVTGSTSGPIQNTTTYAVIPEMTQTITFKGNKVIMIFTGTILASIKDSNLGAFAFFKDGTQLSTDFIFDPGAGANALVSLSFIDTPSAASHTYDVRWKAGSGGQQFTATGTARTFQIVELG